jgi:hypothetical protein
MSENPKIFGECIKLLGQLFGKEQRAKEMPILSWHIYNHQITKPERKKR